MTNEFADISEMGFPGLPHVCSHWASVPSPELCNGETWKIPKGLEILPRARSTFLTSGFANGLEFETNCTSFCDFSGGPFFDSKIHFRLLGKTCAWEPSRFSNPESVSDAKKIAVDCVPAHVYRHPFLRNLAQ